MTTLAQFFQNTSYATASRPVINAQLVELTQKYPTMRSLRLPRPNSQLVNLAADGTIPISVDGRRYGLPFRVFLPDKFPAVSPSCIIPRFPSNSGTQFVNKQGIVDLARITSWGVPSTLAGLVLELPSFFSAQCPVPLPYLASLQQPAPPQPQPPAPDGGAAAGVFAAANEAISAQFATIEDGNAQVRRHALAEQAVRLSDVMLANLAAMNAQLREEFRPDGALAIQPEIERVAQARAAHEGFIETMSDLNRLWHEGGMTAEEYVTALRKFGRVHFLSVVGPAISG
jgi:hypothetical protein